LEPLEERRLLATLTVDTLSDTVDAGDGVTSLREAVAAANMAAGADTIEFALSLGDGGPAAIFLTQGEIAIAEALTIDARSVAQGVTIDANLMSRVFNITATTGDFTLAGLTLINGKTTGSNSSFTDSTFSGGAVRCASSGLLIIDHCLVRKSSTSGSLARGGGIFTSSELSVTHTTVSDNSTTGFNSNGGGVFAYGGATLDRCVISRNVTKGRLSEGGGISVGAENVIVVLRSLIEGNSTEGIEAGGGGIDFSLSNLTLSESTISGNWTSGYSAYGGGIYGGNATITNSTISGNQTWADNSRGGALDVNLDLTISQSTISGNVTHGRNAPGSAPRNALFSYARVFIGEAALLRAPFNSYERDKLRGFLRARRQFQFLIDSPLDKLTQRYKQAIRRCLNENTPD
jgi:hypothetical protein